MFDFIYIYNIHKCPTVWSTNTNPYEFVHDNHSIYHFTRVALYVSSFKVSDKCGSRPFTTHLILYPFIRHTPESPIFLVWEKITVDFLIRNVTGVID